MNRWRVRFLLLFTFLVVESCSRIDGQRLATRSMERNTWASVMGAKEKPSASNFLYVVRSKSGKPCTLTNMTINVMIPTKEQTVTVTVPKNAVANGTCKPTTSELTLSWKNKAEATNNMIKFTFINDHTKFSVFSINVEIYDDDGKLNLLKASSDIDLRLFAASTKSGIHSCSEPKKVKVGDGEVTITDVSLVAFNTDNEFSSRTEEKCDDKDNIKTFPYVLNDKGKICILARMSISLEITYKTTDSKTKSAVMHVPNDASVTGYCANKNAQMVLVWSEKSEEKSTFALNKTDNSITFDFVNNGTNAFLSRVTTTIFMDKTNFNDSQEDYVEATIPDSELFPVTSKNGIYSCAHDTTLTSRSNNVKVIMDDVLLVPFINQNDFALTNVADCTDVTYDYVVNNDETGISCILANMKIEIHVPYETSDETDNSTKTAILHVPPKAEAKGSCSIKVSSMELSWTEAEDKKLVNKITFHIVRNETTFMVSQIEVEIHKDERNFPNATSGKSFFGDASDYGPILFPALVDTGVYICNNSQTVQAGEIEIIISNVNFIAFNTEEYLLPRSATTCIDESSSTSSTETTTKPSEPNVTTPNEPLPDQGIDSEFNYRVINPETNVVCILANMSISMKISWEAENSETKTATLNVPLAAEATGNCIAGIMYLTWLPDSKDESNYESEEKNKVTFNFKKDQTTYFLDSVNVLVLMDDKHFPGIGSDKTFNDTAKDLNKFPASLSNLYQCASEKSIKGERVEMTIKDVAWMVFNEQKDATWKSVEKCDDSEEDSDSNVGAIVGGVIGGVIVISVIVFGIVMYRKKRLFR